MDSGNTPSKDWGLGIRSALQLAPSAYLASAAACSDLVSHNLPSHLSCSPHPYLDRARDSALPMNEQVSTTKRPGIPLRSLPQLRDS